ncbi:polysaccharide deacetylase family protein [Microbacterium sp.]|uniref:polysaccharide deacetylase family protein n=1 Tax=Microbacterium sp. TaxID=51671 RepID=UPI002C2C2E79|nr:polysaccharide deacetylase family protein [Microbacterium sp.]HWK76504.1 polysaccharide deacetylase family protein [Microbacterium sp.]
MTIHLCFHGIGSIRHEREPGESRYWISEDVFLGILDRVRGRTDVELSFDDGNRSDADIALPALIERGLGATFFALAGRLDDPLSLGRDDLRQLHAWGMRVGSHGWDHVPWRGLDSADAHREFVEARFALEEASGMSIRHAALPLGRYDRKTLRRLRDAGYRAVFTSDRFPSNDTAWLRPRYSVTATDTVDSVVKILDGRPGIDSAVRLGKSLVKRMR